MGFLIITNEGSFSGQVAANVSEWSPVGQKPWPQKGAKGPKSTPRFLRLLCLLAAATLPSTSHRQPVDNSGSRPLVKSFPCALLSLALGSGLFAAEVPQNRNTYSQAYGETKNPVAVDPAKDLPRYPAVEPKDAPGT